MTHEALHLAGAVQHRVVHVYIDDAGAVLDLLCRYLQCFVIFSF